MDELRLSDEALTYVAARYGRPKWATGTISRGDAAFLFDIVLRSRPRIAAEIGVASGVSTVFLSTLLSDRLRASRLFAFDHLDRVYDQPERRLGAFIWDVFGSLPENLTLAPGVGSTDLRHWERRPEIFDFVFLDANHAHPWPCIDLLSNVDLITPGAWVALHDIRLPVLQPDMRQYGPLYLFHAWPGEKCAPSVPDANTGAIRFFENPADTIAALIECCRMPWQMQLPESVWTSAFEALCLVDEFAFEPLKQIVRHPRIAKEVRVAPDQIAVRGINPWSRIPPALAGAPVVLHANRTGEPELTLSVRGLSRQQCAGVVMPTVSASGECEVPLIFSVCIRSPNSGHELRHTLVLSDTTPQFLHLGLPQEIADVFEIEFTVKLSSAIENYRGAWVKLEALHFV